MIKRFLMAAALVAFLWPVPGRTADKGTITGVWHFVFNTDGGDREFDSRFDQDGEKVTGRWDVGDKKEGDPITGTFIGKELSLAFTQNSEIGPGTLTVKGHLGDDGALSGDWGFQGYTGSFKAMRVKEQTK